MNRGDTVFYYDGGVKRYGVVIGADSNRWSVDAHLLCTVDHNAKSGVAIASIEDHRLTVEED